MYATGGSSGHSPANHRGATPITVCPTDPDLGAEHVVAPAVFGLPHRVTEHDDRIAGRQHVLALREVATEPRWRVEEVEEPGRHASDLHVAPFFSGTHNGMTGAKRGYSNKRAARLGDRPIARVRNFAERERAVVIGIRI